MAADYAESGWTFSVEVVDNVGWNKLRAVPANRMVSTAGTARSLFQPTWNHSFAASGRRGGLSDAVAGSEFESAVA
jgi:hypothetical protein